MLVLRRSEGQWVEVTHRSGDRLRFRVYDLSRDAPGRVHLAFEDPARNFEIERPERVQRVRAAAAAAASTAPASTAPASSAGPHLVVKAVATATATGVGAPAAASRPLA